MIREISTVQNVSNANIARKKSQYFVSIKIRIMLCEIMDKNSADKIFGGHNFRHRAKFSAIISAEFLSDKVLWRSFGEIIFLLWKKFWPVIVFLKKSLGLMIFLGNSSSPKKFLSYFGTRPEYSINFAPSLSLAFVKISRRQNVRLFFARD